MSGRSRISRDNSEKHSIKRRGRGHEGGRTKNDRRRRSRSRESKYMKNEKNSPRRVSREELRRKSDIKSKEKRVRKPLPINRRFPVALMTGIFKGNAKAHQLQERKSAAKLAEIEKKISSNK